MGARAPFALQRSVRGQHKLQFEFSHTQISRQKPPARVHLWRDWSQSPPGGRNKKCLQTGLTALRDVTRLSVRVGDQGTLQSPHPCDRPVRLSDRTPKGVM